MESLQIARSKDTLGVNFNAKTGVLTLEGSSYPENPVAFFKPLTHWLRGYIQETHGVLTLNINIGYLNTSSSKCLIDFLEMLDKYYRAGGPVTLNWHYEADDEDMLESGREMCEDLEIPCTMIPV